MSLTEDKSRVAKVLRERKGVTMTRNRILDIINKNAEVDVDNALASLVTDGKISSKDSQSLLFAITTTTV